EEAGQLFRDIALAISAAVGLSLIISLTVIPTATARLLQSSDQEKSHGDARQQSEVATPTPVKRVAETCNALAERFVDGVVGLNRFVHARAPRRWLTIGSLLAFSIGISARLWPKVEYLPTGNRNLVFGIILPPPGYNLDELMTLGEIVEQHLQPYWDIDADTIEPSQLEYPPIHDFFYVARGRQVFLGVRAVDPTRAGELIPLISSVRSKLPGTIVIAKQSSLFEQGLTAGRTVDIEITGPDLTRLVALGGQVIGQVSGGIGEAVVPNAQSRPVPSLDLSNPEVHVEPKLIAGRQMGINASRLGYAVNALVDGAFAADYFIGGDKIDLTLIGDPDEMRRSQDMASLPIATPSGQLVPLSSLASIRLASGPEQINHRERQRAITIEVSPPPEVALEDALQRIESQIVDPLRSSGQLDGGYRITLAGTADKLKATWLSLRWNVLLALLITYLLMAALFESWVYPFVIILSVPLGAVGGILGLRALGIYLHWQGSTPQPLDVLTMLGFVILIGTVVNNAILIVHQSLNLMRDQLMSSADAILESVRTRVRPILMTTATTVLGLCPLVLFPGSGSELYRGLGSVLLGGMLVSTIFTLLFVPTVFRIFMGWRRLDRV
ncbi:MAG: efflux RND transporter permease subunit, partial [Planctomycetota bacterium]